MRNIIEILKNKNETLFYFGLICFVAALFFLLLSKINSNPIMGVNGWIKPFKFCISTFILAWTMGYYMQFLHNQNQVSLYNWSLIIFLSIEIILIIYQASRGKISHFNQEDNLGRTIFSIMAIAITIFMLHTAYISSLFFTQKSFDATETLILAIQLSLVITVLFAFEGFAMGAILKHTVGGNDGSEGLPLVELEQNIWRFACGTFFRHACFTNNTSRYLLFSQK